MLLVASCLFDKTGQQASVLPPVYLVASQLTPNASSFPIPHHKLHVQL